MPYVVVVRNVNSKILHGHYAFLFQFFCILSLVFYNCWPNSNKMILQLKNSSNEE